MIDNDPRPQETRRGVLVDRGDGRGAGVRRKLRAGMLGHEPRCDWCSRSQCRLSSDDVGLGSKSKVRWRIPRMVRAGWCGEGMDLDGGEYLEKTVSLLNIRRASPTLKSR